MELTQNTVQARKLQLFHDFKEKTLSAILVNCSSTSDNAYLKEKINEQSYFY